MLWPLLLLLAGVVAAAVGWVALLASCMAPAQYRLSFGALLAWLFPLGIVAVLVAIVWLVVELVRWLA